MNNIRRLYDWVLGWADSRYATPALATLSFTESFFFPLPPDPLLMALSLSKPKRAYFFATICSAASVVGGVAGYYIGLTLFDVIGKPILDFYGAMDKYLLVQTYFRTYDAWAVGVAGFTPIPYKVFTISAGAFRISFLVFVLASVVSRSARFFIVAGLIKHFGGPIRSFIDHYFNILTFVFIALLTGGFLLLKLVK
ncbi:MAG: DedA family protein [Nitrospinaceae bacterium]|jgi:membrane protein YqaA with SNARE-associated domain|nr:DedA family protein [Nitrospinaceae bacterium]MBT3820053.1 DedA family protein [Nitrospinaceae bacterium]MBT5366966.1 DedA family protein [Nitrospinaceae bacterium]MBT6393260.1 DedA family protein [Nitrospinaceae bacterium]MBT7855610.1 DedA family protein [Nitrospinaceae bacterium]